MITYTVIYIYSTDLFGPLGRGLQLHVRVVAVDAVTKVGRHSLTRIIIVIRRRRISIIIIIITIIIIAIILTITIILIIMLIMIIHNRL